MYWNQTAECMDREALRELQLRRLKNTVNRVYKNVPVYRARMQEAGVMPEDIRSLDDLKYLPFTVKQDLRDNYPYGMFSAPLSEIVRLHASSGTTGKPTVVGYAQKDIINWSEMAARALVMAGATQRSVVQVSYGYGLFTGGLGLHYGVERLGASVIPMSGGNSKKQIMLMRDFGTTELCCTPSYALQLAETMKEMGVDPSELKLRGGIFGAEPWSEEMRKQIEERLHIEAHDIYGLSEIMGPGVACDCQYQNGMHIQEDHFIAEIIDPVTLEPLPYGERGELVFTTITKEGMPLIRYRTRDITTITDARCECGRTMARMHKVMGRSDDMLIIRGVNVFPSQIESVIGTFKELEPHYLIIVDRKDNSDTIEVQVELSGEYLGDTIGKIEELKQRVLNDFRSVLGLNVKLTFVEPKTLARSEGKAQHVIDRRKI